ncbi:S41 family peptidase [Massilia aerilata]|uniref:S41 family peptidase n=1 Tax=Massilia aerilata TaxID=453817 RepID=A0ABW0S2D4_9BURK
MKRNALVLVFVLSLALTGTLIAMPELYQRYLPEPVADGATRAQTIDTLLGRLNQHYVFPETAKRIEALLRKKQHDGKYDTVTDGEQFAAQLTADMASVAHDLHMKVKFSPKPLRPGRALMTNALSQATLHHNDGLDNVDHLSPAIGYLKISTFPPPSLVAEKYASAMNKLSDTDALIVDLRDNHGGSAESVALLISYFVDRPTRLNDFWSRDSGQTRQTWTQNTLAGKRYGSKKPVAILVNRVTASGAEDFTYTMHALKRATVIGERTLGAANPIALHRLGDHFFAAIPDSRPINPITHTNWEGSGITPDMPARPADALTVAKDIMQRQLDAAGRDSP